METCYLYVSYSFYNTYACLCNLKKTFWFYWVVCPINFSILSSSSFNFLFNFFNCLSLNLLINVCILLTWWWWWWMMMNCSCGMVERRKTFSVISSRDHYHRSSPSRVPDTPRAGFEPAQNLSSGLVEWSCAVVITTTPRRRFIVCIIAFCVCINYNKFTTTFFSSASCLFSSKVRFLPICFFSSISTAKRYSVK